MQTKTKTPQRKSEDPARERNKGRTQQTGRRYARRRRALEKKTPKKQKKQKKNKIGGVGVHGLHGCSVVAGKTYSNRVWPK